MPSRHLPFVTTCQQLLVLGVVCVALTPAAAVVSLELVPPDAAGGASGGTTVTASPMAAYVSAQATPSRVPTGVVEPTVAEYALTAPVGARVAPRAMATARARVTPSGSRLVSEPQPVTGFGSVGVTWGHGQSVPDVGIRLAVRSRDDDGWSGWALLEYHDDHGPDPGSLEARRARPGTDEMLVGHVEQVQVRVTSDRTLPADMQLVVVDPGEAASSERELPALDTDPTDEAAESTDPAALPTSEGDLALSRAARTPKPTIYSRAQWGADERMRDRASLSYYEVHAGFVHHTVNANDYSRADVPAILRGIYAYHTQSRGWSDVGYNFLVDRFGRIWEGRAGGVDRPVVGAHTLGYNENSFAMSAIGNFETARPSAALVQSYAALFAWKLSLHGVNAGSRSQDVAGDRFQAINGHRDADATACPGRYLYAKIPIIRRLAAQLQVGWSGRQLESNLVRGERPDIVARRASDKHLVVIPLRKTRRGLSTGSVVDTGVVLDRADRVMNAGDWNRDGRGDIITRRASDGRLFLRRGRGDGTFRLPRRLAQGFGSVRLLATVGDMTGDGWPDLMGQPRGGDMRIYPGRGTRGLAPSYVAYHGVPGLRQIPVGRWGADGAPDTMVRRGRHLNLFTGNGPGGFTGERRLGLDLRPYNWVVGISDIDLTGHSDLVVRSKDGVLHLLPATRRSIGKPVRLGRGFAGYDLVG